MTAIRAKCGNGKVSFRELSVQHQLSHTCGDDDSYSGRNFPRVHSSESLDDGGDCDWHIQVEWVFYWIKMYNTECYRRSCFRWKVLGTGYRTM